MTNDLAGRGVADEKALANAKQIANTFTPFYGETRSEKLLSLLVDHSAAVKEYSEATVAESKSRQDAALARLASNAEDIDVFFNGVNSHHPAERHRARPDRGP